MNIEGRSSCFLFPALLSSRLVVFSILAETDAAEFSSNMACDRHG